jgi:hypothetical protein
MASVTGEVAGALEGSWTTGRALPGPDAGEFPGVTSAPAAAAAHTHRAMLRAVFNMWSVLTIRSSADTDLSAQIPIEARSQADTARPDDAFDGAVSRKNKLTTTPAHRPVSAIVRVCCRPKF